MKKLLLIFMGLLILSVLNCAPKIDNASRIKPYNKNPRYWQYKGQPVLLYGGTIDDNLFQISDLEQHLKLVNSVGGNYARCTMSSRNEGNIWTFFKENENGPYDLMRFNNKYWQKFETFLRLTHQYDIIVQIEIWATFDFYREPWDMNPFNPKNNINYSTEESGLPEQVTTHPTKTENNFFWSVPAENNQEIVLKYQQRYVDKLLSHALKYGHILYCMDNETSVTPEWGKYWSEYIKTKAEEAGVEVHTTEMWDPWDLAHEMHNATFEHPETYSFVDISQNNHQRGQAHWDNAQRQRARIANHPCPLNNIKIYGEDGYMSGGAQDGMERFWRNLIGGMATSRFHRPTSGLGMNAKAQACTRSMRMLTAKLDIINATPDSESQYLSDRSENEAYLTYIKGKQYAVYFTDGGSVGLDLSASEGTFTVQWLNIAASKWQDVSTVQGGGIATLNAPGSGQWVVLLEK